MEKRNQTSNDKIMKQKRVYGLQFVLEWALRLCSIFFPIFLAIQTIFLTNKLFTFAVFDCIRDGIRNDSTLSNQAYLDLVRHSCWTFGYYKDYFEIVHFKGEELAALNDYKNVREWKLIKFEYEQKEFAQKILLLTYSLFLVQILLYCIQKKVDFFARTIEMLKERPINFFSEYDRKRVLNRFSFAVENSQHYFAIQLFVRFIYQFSLFALIGWTKLVLYGQYQLDEFDFETIVLFPKTLKFGTTKTEGDNLKNRQLIDPTFSMILDEIYKNLWFAFLGVLFAWTLLMSIKSLNSPFLH